MIDQAYLWLCRQRKNYPPNADIWDFRFHWATHKPRLIRQLRTGRYTFAPQQRLVRADGTVIHLWGSQDALVMKAMALVLGPRLPISPRCTHVTGNGGLKGALRWVRSRLSRYRYVFRTDVQGYYDHIDQALLIRQLEPIVKDKVVMRLLVQCIQRTVEWGGTFLRIRRGIGRGCPLSPLFGALYLKPLDDAMEQAQIPYVRYMDDWVVLETRRWRLRKAIRLVNQVLNDLFLEKHPEKTWIGPIDRGFDFLGYRHIRAGCYPAKDTVQRFHARITRLYEQGTPPARIGVYEARWWRWVYGGLPKGAVLVKHLIRRLPPA